MLERLAVNTPNASGDGQEHIARTHETVMERRVLHATLQNNEYAVTTYSEGEEPYARVVIKPR